MLKAGIISLGCPRNLLDSEIIAGSLKKSGFKIREPEDGVDVCVINTCAFIESARAESVDKIMEAARLKKIGLIKRLVVCGCLPQLYKNKLAKELKEADLLVGTSDFPKLAGLLKNASSGAGRRSFISRSLNYLYDEKDPRFRLTPRHYAYVKISEGCSNFCSYCIISKLRGKFRSRSIPSVVKEVQNISASNSLREIDIIGQDTTRFGIDRYGKIIFAGLLREICRVRNNVRWVRILYTHPAHYTKELIRALRDEDKICKYLDLPIQHISDTVLKRMNRPTTRIEIEKLIGELRREIPGVILRTSLIAGFPGETDKDFKELLDFVRDTRFERLGAFMYSREEGARAARFGRQVPQKVKAERYDEVMRLQRSISSEINRSFLGKTLDVLIDTKTENREPKTEFIGRTQGDAPEIDGAVRVSGNGIKAGEFYRVKITDSLEYDLIGEKV
ncbi:MAG: 30S ribosomal protein S12 methylthiotransferase RimO [Candidatus Omnitrophica bacterium]|nr:30S ribosomal protein S12 methylthiotransferase RimO [Candidatus Omnitrophota bacterium]